MKTKKTIIIALLLFALTPTLFSQRLDNIIEVNIPLNTTKENAIDKLKRADFKIEDSKQFGDYKVLKYSRYANYNHSEAHVDLYVKNGTIAIIKWYCKSLDELLLEFEEETDMNPYYTVNGKDEDLYYYHWKSNTLVLGRTNEGALMFMKALMYGSDVGTLAMLSSNSQKINNLIDYPHYVKITSNAIAAQEIQAYEQQLFEQAEELRRQAEEKERLEAEQRKQDSIRQAEEMERKAREEERQRLAALKQVYASCRFLFDSEESFEACITNETEAENEIIELIGKKIDEISEDVKTGKEFRDLNSKSSRDMLYICNMSTNSTTVSTYREQRLKEFVSERKALNREYKKSRASYYTLFLRYYLQNSNKNGKSDVSVGNILLGSLPLVALAGTFVYYLIKK